MMYPKLTINTPLALINQYAQNTLVDRLESVSHLWAKVGSKPVCLLMSVLTVPEGFTRRILLLAETLAGLGSMLTVDILDLTFSGFR